MDLVWGVFDVLNQAMRQQHASWIRTTGNHFERLPGCSRLHERIFEGIRIGICFLEQSVIAGGQKLSVLPIFRFLQASAPGYG